MSQLKEHFRKPFSSICVPLKWSHHNVKGAGGIKREVKQTRSHSRDPLGTTVPKSLQAAMSGRCKVHSHQSCTANSREQSGNIVSRRGKPSMQIVLSRGAKLAANHCPKNLPSQFGNKVKTRRQRKSTMLFSSAFNGKMPSTSDQSAKPGASTLNSVSSLLIFMQYIYYSTYFPMCSSQKINWKQLQAGFSLFSHDAFTSRPQPLSQVISALQEWCCLREDITMRRVACFQHQSHNQLYWPSFCCQARNRTRVCLWSRY